MTTSPQKLTLPALAGCVILAFAAAGAAAQPLKSQIVGTWAVQSNQFEKGGKTVEPFGPHPNGYIIYTPGGHFSVHFVNPNIPNFASDNRMKGTPKEIRAAFAGNLACFGTYKVDEADHMVTAHILGHSFPNLIGSDQKRIIKIKGDQMTFIVPHFAGGRVVATLQRVE